MESHMSATHILRAHEDFGIAVADIRWLGGLHH